MGIIKQGILGGFNGKVGTVVGSSWKGEAYMRGLAQHVKNPKTEKQLEQRHKMDIAQQFMKQVLQFINIGLKNVAKKQSPFNYAVRQMVNNAIGDAPDYTIDYSKIVLSHGILTPPSVQIMYVNETDLDILWGDQNGHGNAKDDDVSITLFYNVEKQEVFFDLNGFIRSVGTSHVRLPDDWVGDHIHAWFAMRSADNKLITNSEYLGYYRLE